MIDHNNFSQSVDGLEEAEIIEIVDHHNIGNVVTKKPINFRNSRTGSVSTIIFNMFNEANVTIPKNIAGILASAIISDTLLLTSPTTTSKDEEALKKLSEIAEIDYEKYGKELLIKGMSIKGLSNEAILHKDFKTFKVNEDMLGIGQILTTDFSIIKKKLPEMVSYLNETAKKESYKILCLFVTDIFENVSYCIFNEQADDIVMLAFDLKEVYQGIPLPGIVSRKIQIVPNIMEALDK